jgi:hypothetical protein
VWGFLFSIFSIFILKTIDVRMSGLMLAAIFFYVAYTKISTYTNLLSVISPKHVNTRKRKRSSRGRKHRRKMRFRR